MSGVNDTKNRYAEVVIPLRFKESLTYLIPDEYIHCIQQGSIVKIKIGNATHQAIVRRILSSLDFDPKKIKKIEQVLNLPPIPAIHIKFLEQVSKYYMCPIGDTFRFAAFSSVKTSKREDKLLLSKNTDSDLMDQEVQVTQYPKPNEGSQEGPNLNPTAPSFPLPTLSYEQQKGLEEILEQFKNGKPVLLNGITGSGKTEIYIHLAARAISQGKNVLYLIPEIAISRQIESRLKKVFGEYLKTYHSKKTVAYKREVYKTIATNSAPTIILGARSALFLPFEELGLIVVDEEHDSSYKQTDSAPRYNGRDTALILSSLLKSNIILGSATPSLESLYNVSTGKFAQVNLSTKYYGDSDCKITVVDMNQERKKWAVKGSISKILIKAIQKRLEAGEQILIFRSRRAYATAIQCPECGHIPKCPRCNIPLHLHKTGNYLSCHICGFSSRSDWNKCNNCQSAQMKTYGPGTERIEEELQNLFPDARIARFDADSTSSKKEEERILKQFAAKEIDIIVGTQMISKGFDFEGLTLAAVIKGEALASIFDFRADEKALQLLTQIKGRVGRRGNSAEMIIQTSRPEHPIFKMIQYDYCTSNSILGQEREDFSYPPYTRLIRITIKSPFKNKTEKIAAEVYSRIKASGATLVIGPTAPPIEVIDKEYHLQILIKLKRDKRSIEIKDKLFELLKEFPSNNCITDVDPINA